MYAIEESVEVGMLLVLQVCPQSHYLVLLLVLLLAGNPLENKIDVEVRNETVDIPRELDHFC